MRPRTTHLVWTFAKQSKQSYATLIRYSVHKWPRGENSVDSTAFHSPIPHPPPTPLLSPCPRRSEIPPLPHTPREPFFRSIYILTIMRSLSYLSTSTSEATHGTTPGRGYFPPHPHGSGGGGGGGSIPTAALPPFLVPALAAPPMEMYQWTSDQIQGMIFFIFLIVAYTQAGVVDTWVAQQERKQNGLCPMCGGVYAEGSREDHRCPRGKECIHYPAE